MKKKVFLILILAVVIVLVVVLVRRDKKVEAPKDALYLNWNSYETEQYSLQYPKDFSFSEEYHYQALGPGKGITGIAFTIPVILTKNTNLSKDTKLSIETIPNKEDCTPADFLSAPTVKEPLTENGIQILVAEQSEGAAGNRYDETVYVYPKCVAVRYFIHSTNIGNYTPGTVQEFDRAALLQAFTLIRASFQIHEKEAAI
ncbi:MAG TPA: hypothetical protein VLB02_01040 [Candidatus Paceibacterota bacterium]|nr:hypothetical protein [Candidatus Paceibacterota bacterium]